MSENILDTTLAKAHSGDVESMKMAAAMLMELSKQQLESTGNVGLANRIMDDAEYFLHKLKAMGEIG